MDSILGSASNFEQLGIVAVLFVVIVFMGLMLKSIYKQERACQDERLRDSEDRADLRQELGALATKVEMMHQLHRETLRSRGGGQ
jgi:flagellar biosynthesis/type III secretory pathway M-ring protein FliF/YscJ